MCWLAHVMSNVGTEYEDSTFGHSKDIKGVPKVGMSSFTPSKVMEGSRILNYGHVTLTTPILWSNLLSDGKYLLCCICLPNMKSLC